MTSNIIEPTGHVPASSQRTPEAFKQGQNIHPMVGIILQVHPSDNKENLSASSHPQLRGCRHEALVLAAPHYGQPDTLIPECVIPPSNHSGVDNFGEDLPRGVASMIGKDLLNTDFDGVDYTKLDGEWCIVSFIGGRLEQPYISNWCPHPSNNFEPATSGEGDKGAALKQADPAKNRFRKFSRVNGVEKIITRDGDVYLDTSQAGRRVSFDPKTNKLTIKQVGTGGNVQVDVKKSGQMEINFNVKKMTGPRIGAGSSKAKPVTQSDLPHPEQSGNISGSPSARETSRTYVRAKQQSVFLKTSDLQVSCADEGGEDGVFNLLAETQVTLSQQASGDTAAIINIVDGEIMAVAADGSNVFVGDDKVAAGTKSGALIAADGKDINVFSTTVIVTWFILREEKT